MKGKCSFVYLKTGGGHLAPARSVSSFLQTHHPDTLEPVLVDGLSGAPVVVRFLVEDGYRHLQARARWLYTLIYLANKWKPIARLNAFVMSLFVTPYLERHILSERPKKIIIFHFLLIKPIADILSRHRLATPTLVVVTDPFTAHPIWFLDKRQRFIVFSEELQKDCIARGLKEEQVSVFPFILHEKFSTCQSLASRLELKKQMGFDPDRKLVLIIGGADGIPKGKQIVRNLIQQNPEAEIAVVCGRNKHLMNTVMSLKEKLQLSTLKVFGFVDSVYELLQISDVVVTKCGASMFMETLLSRKIPVVNNYLWEQEKGNVDFLQRNQLGIYERNTRKISHRINTLLTDSNLMDLFQKNIEQVKFKNGVDQVAEYIIRFDHAFAL